MTALHWLLLSGVVAIEVLLQLRVLLLRRKRREVFKRYESLIPSSSKAEDSEPWIARGTELEALDTANQKLFVPMLRIVQLSLIAAFGFALLL